MTFSTTAATLQSNIQAALTGGGLATQIGNNPPGPTGTPNSVVVVTNDVSTGANVLVTFQSALATTTSQLLSSTTPGVTVGLATINAANNIPGNGIPIALSSGQNVLSGSFTLQYNPSLLTITGVVSKLTISGATFTLVSNNTVTGTAVLSLSSPTRLTASASPVTLGSLLATVPLSAAATYGAKQLLHFSSEQLTGTGGPIAVTNEDGVEVTAFFGDVTDTGGPFTLQDAGAIAAVAGQVPNTVLLTLPGFSAFANLDPVIIGDVSLQGSVNSTDAGAMNQQVGGTAKPTIPYAPIGLPVTPVGPDPALSVPTNLVAVAGGTLVVPVDIDTARPDGSGGMLDAVLALSYNPQVFEVSAADVQLGTVPEGSSGWQVHAEVNAQTGQIGIELFSNSPIQSTAGGSLVTIAMHVLEHGAGGDDGVEHRAVRGPERRSAGVPDAGVGWVGIVRAAQCPDAAGDGARGGGRGDDRRDGRSGKQLGVCGDSRIARQHGEREHVRGAADGGRRQCVGECGSVAGGLVGASVWQPGAGSGAAGERGGAAWGDLANGERGAGHQRSGSGGGPGAVGVVIGGLPDVFEPEARRGQPALVDGLLEEAGESDDLAGLEAFFAREAKELRS